MTDLKKIVRIRRQTQSQAATVHQRHRLHSEWKQEKRRKKKEKKSIASNSAHRRTCLRTRRCVPAVSEAAELHRQMFWAHTQSRPLQAPTTAESTCRHFETDAIEADDTPCEEREASRTTEPSQNFFVYFFFFFFFSLFRLHGLVIVSLRHDLHSYCSSSRALLVSAQQNHDANEDCHSVQKQIQRRVNRVHIVIQRALDDHLRVKSDKEAEKKKTHF